MTWVSGVVRLAAVVGGVVVLAVVVTGTAAVVLGVVTLRGLFVGGAEVGSLNWGWGCWDGHEQMVRNKKKIKCMDKEIWS